MGLKTRLAVLEEKVKAERRIGKIRARALRRALKLAREVEAVHFESLNNANARFEMQNATFLPSDTYTVFKEGYEEWRRSVDDSSSRMRGVLWVVGILAVVVGPAVAAAVQYLLR